MSFHHTQAGPADWGRRTMRATGCAAALLLALTGASEVNTVNESSALHAETTTANTKILHA